MIDLYFWKTPNGYKILMYLEEAQMPYRIIPIDINKGEQFEPSFLAISPNNKIPAIVDHESSAIDKPMAVFESGAILLYLAEKYQQFLPNSEPQRSQVLQWLFWQMSALGPMAGQNLHFIHSAPNNEPYSKERFNGETKRLFSVIDKQLASNEYLAGQYSIADIATYPWIKIHEALEINLHEFPNVHRWWKQIHSRPAVINAYKIGNAINQTTTEKIAV